MTVVPIDYFSNASFKCVDQFQFLTPAHTNLFTLLVWIPVLLLCYLFLLLYELSVLCILQLCCSFNAISLVLLLKAWLDTEY